MLGPRCPTSPLSPPRLQLHRPLLLLPARLSRQRIEQLPLRRPGPASPASGTRLLRPAPPLACGLRTSLGLRQPAPSVVRTPPPACPKNSPGTRGPRLPACCVRDSTCGFRPRPLGWLRALLTGPGVSGHAWSPLRVEIPQPALAVPQEHGKEHSRFSKFQKDQGGSKRECFIFVYKGMFLPNCCMSLIA
ncbi:synaptojanin-1-like [Zalophus californianus]|uniref:Synaptojanin-1-like n=1 Tax=Zalophus californianus TaxID=9704 RepID=A0A6P9FKT5_ZALCA|nr:synaptojanin-1-like [Zalophus californianus]